VEHLGWSRAKLFASRTGLALPTEAQWEYACRAGTETAFAFGDSIDTDQANFSYDDTDACDSSGITRGTTVPVDSLVPNGFGLHHMHGNAAEWCEDGYDPEFYSQEEATKPDPILREPSGQKWVTRGGDYSDTAERCRSAARNPEFRRWPEAGIRVVWPPR
jgi:formylglycine-generating enzyme required for sulfatase activity